MKKLLLLLIITTLFSCTKEDYINIEGVWKIEKLHPNTFTLLEFTNDSLVLRDVVKTCSSTIMISQHFSYTQDKNIITLRKRMDGYNCVSVWNLTLNGNYPVMQCDNIQWTLIPYL